MKALTIWQRDAAYSNYRIPGILVTRSGTVLAWCEARKDACDWAMMNILLIRSTDGGLTFSAPTVMAGCTETHPTVNNPVAVQGADGRIHFLYCEDYGIRGGRILHRVSEDDGRTWSEPDDITSACLPDYHNAFALGPGHGLCAPDGSLLVPCWMVPKSAGAELTAHGPSVVSVLVSHDNGLTWHMGDLLPEAEGVVSPGETELCMCRDGRVYLNTRLSWGCRCRAQAWSADGCTGWQGLAPVPSLIDPCCFGSVVSGIGADGVFRLFYVGCRDTEERVRVSVSVSEDDGASWQVYETVDEVRGGYADCAQTRDGRGLFVLYEDKYGEACYLARVSLPGEET